MIEETDLRDAAHIACNCVPDLGPEHCHVCSTQQGREVPWTECVSQGHVEGTSQNARIEHLLGRRDESGPLGIVLFSPAEQGYACPVHGDSSAGCTGRDVEAPLHWGEYNATIWCALCDKDYPSALCHPDLDRQIEILLDTVEDALSRRLARIEEILERYDESDDDDDGWCAPEDRWRLYRDMRAELRTAADNTEQDRS